MDNQLDFLFLKGGLSLIRLENHLGVIEISQPYFASLIGNAASSCFGVAQFLLCLTFELRILDLDTDNCSQSLTDILTCQVRLIIF